eukprot:15365467-Ditylum_brightwellii.AAC.1
MKQKEIENKRKEAEIGIRACDDMKNGEENDFIKDILIAIYNDPRVETKGIKKSRLADFLQENYATNGTAAEIARTAGTDTEEDRGVQFMGDVKAPFISQNFSA